MMLETKRTECKGLTSSDANRLLRIHGRNEIVHAQHLEAFTQLVSFFINPLVVILLVASAISALVGELANSLIIVTMVLFSVTLDYLQHNRAQKAEQALKKRVAQTTTVLRDGCWSEIAVSSIVPGDLIRIDAGNLIPADAELISARDLHVNEAALTGESFPAAKYCHNGKEQSDDLGRVFFGTSVVSGNGTARVFATGSSTVFGDVAKQLGTKPPETEFERGTRRFGMLITRTVFILVLFVLTTNLYFGRDPIQSLLFALALAVGLTPEFLPMILTVTLGSGALKMAKRKVIVKHLSAIQNFGSIDVLCSDKTGTITSGEMTLEGCFDAQGNTSQKTLRLAYLNSAYETGIKNPLDAAILEHSKIDISATKKLDELPFDFERRRVSVVVKDSDVLLISKGAPETILSCCTQFDSNGNSQKLSDDVLQQINETWKDWSRNGHRVIAVAYKKENDGIQEWSTTDESDLTLAGFITFLDPVLPEATEMILALRKDGIKVKILTGDNELVTAHVCSKVGISQKQILNGSEIDRLTPPALAHAVERCSVFVRVSPAQKYKIILALKARGHVVGFLGDGINDAPSLHAADVGISVANATDVAKDAAEIILMERNLSILHEGIIEGRRAFGNVFKYLLMGTSSNFGNMFSMAGASIFLPFLPMLPMQILLNNFLYDLAQVTIPTDNVDASYVKKPHRWNISTIRNFMMFVGPISSLYDFLTFFVLLNVFHASEKVFHTGWFIESLATQTLVIFIIRTAGNPFKSTPSAPLTVSTIIVISMGILLPVSPLASALGFTPLPFPFFIFLFVATVTYLFLVQLAKGHVLKQM